MYGFTTVAVLHMALLATNRSVYQEAYDRAEAAGKPLLILVGTEQSSECRVMKEQTLPQLSRSGALKDVVFAAVQSEANPNLTRQLLRGDSLPQLVLYTPVGKLWRRTHLSGAQSEDEILAYLEREIAKGQEVAERASKQTTTASSNPSTIIYSYAPGGS